MAFFVREWNMDKIETPFPATGAGRKRTLAARLLMKSVVYSFALFGLLFIVLNAADAQNFRIFGQTGNIEVEITGKSPNGLNVVYLIKVLSQNQTFFVFEKLKNGKRQALLFSRYPALTVRNQFLRNKQRVKSVAHSRISRQAVRIRRDQSAGSKLFP